MDSRHMKVFIITEHQGYANEKDNEISPHISGNGIHQKTKKLVNQCCQGCGAKGILVHCWWDYPLFQPLWKTV